MIHTSKLSVIQRVSASLFAASIACFFIIGLGLSYSDDITEIYLSEPTIVDLNDNFGEDPDTPKSDTDTLTPSAVLAFAPPTEYLHPFTNISLFRCVSLSTYPATGPPYA